MSGDTPSAISFEMLWIAFIFTAWFIGLSARLALFFEQSYRYSSPGKRHFPLCTQSWCSVFAGFSSDTNKPLGKLFRPDRKYRISLNTGIPISNNADR